MEKGLFKVKSQDPNYQDTWYKLSFGDNNTMPNCECSDWKRNRLPCKHFLVVFTHIENWGFQQLPVHYKESPFLTLDHGIIFSKEPLNYFEETNGSEDMASTTEVTASPCMSAIPDVRPSEIPQRQKYSREWNIPSVKRE